MEIMTDQQGQKYVELDQSGGFKRAWIQRRTDDKNWANVPGGRYLNVCRVEASGTGPKGKATDFPIYSDMLSDEQILKAFAYAVAAITGCDVKDTSLEKYKQEQAMAENQAVWNDATSGADCLAAHAEE